MSEDKKNLEDSYAHVSNGGVRVSLKELVHEDTNIGSSFFLEFKLSNFGAEMSTEIPVNREMCLYLAMMLTQRLKYISENDSKYNVKDAKWSMFKSYSNRDGEHVDISKEAEAFKDFASSFEEFCKNYEIVK